MRAAVVSRSAASSHSSAGESRASFRLFVARVAKTVRIPWNKELKPPSRRAPARLSDMSAGLNPTSYWKPQRVNQDVTLTSFDVLVRIKAACAAALGVSLPIVRP